MYKELHDRIPGGEPGVRRALPNCVVAGVRGLMYGDGARRGYANPSLGEQELQREDHRDTENENPNAAAAALEK